MFADTLFASAIALRQIVVKERFYRKTRAERIADLQEYINNRAAENGVAPVIVSSPHVLKELVRLMGVNFANAVYALASPSIYIKNVNSNRSSNVATALELPGIGRIHFNPGEEENLEKMYTVWAGCFALYAVSAANAYLVDVGNAVAGNVKLSTIFNAAVEPEYQIAVYDEDAVAAAAVLPDPPAEINVEWPVEQTEAEFNAAASGNVDEEEEFNAAN